MLFATYYRWIRDYNLFESHSTDRLLIRKQRWSTRLYIVTLSLAILVLLFYTTLHVTSTQFEFKNPSFDETLDLHRLYPNVRCPCTKISTNYDTFLKISTDFHPICSSVFVSNQWIEYLFQRNITNFRYAADLRATLNHQFQVLRELCRLAIDAVDNGLRTFSKNELISGQLLSKNLFETTIQAEIWAFQRMISEDFLRELTLVRSLIFGNLLMPAIPTAFTLIVRSDSPGVIRATPGINTNFYRDINGSSCWCTDRSTCHISAALYDIDRIDSTRGIFDQMIRSPSKIFNQWFSGCWPMETLLLSNIDAFFNEILPSIDENRTFLPLNRTDDDDEEEEETIEILVEKLFLRSFDHQWNYSSYFNQCRPDSCFIDINERASFLYIVTSLLGLYGGLSVALLFLVPTFVRLSTKCFFQHENHRLIRLRDRRNFLVDLNLFKSSEKTSLIDQRNQRWATRLYLVSLTFAFVFLTLYTSLTVETKITSIKNPSFSTVEQLQRTSISLECPCTSVSSTYANLIELEAEFHQICSSEFISEKWIEGLNRIASSSMESLYFADFRYASPIFQLLKSMCHLANQTILDSLFVFGQNELISSNLLGRELFENQLKSSIDEFQRKTPVALLHLLQLTRNFTFFNQLMTGTLGSFFVRYSNVGENLRPETFLETHGATQMFPNGTTTNCSCANDIQCGRKAAFYTGPSGQRRVIFTVPGFYSRCWPLESLLPSTFECFYDTNSCLDQIAQITNESFYTELKRLNSSKSSRFQSNTTIDELLSNLFVENWSSKRFYSTYFDICRPISCSHSVSTRKNVVELLTTLMGLIGGLSVAFRLIIPQFVSLSMNFIEKRRRPIEIRKKFLFFVKNFNVFERQHRLNVNEFELFLQRQSTRVYFVLLTIALIILMIYTSLTYQNNNKIVTISSLNNFRKLRNLSTSSSINCRCSQLSFSHRTFSHVEATFHPICSSDFVSTNWLDFVFLRFLNGNSSNFRHVAFPHFQTLKLICDLTRQAVIDARDLYLDTNIIAASMLDEEVFHQSTKATWKSFESTFSQTFLHSFEMLIGMTQGNGLMSAYSTNWNLFLPNMTKDATIYAQSKIFQRCDCATSIFCIEKPFDELFGFVVGCLPINTFLHSTFECFYNRSCLETMFNLLNSNQTNISIRILEKNASRFENSILNSQIVNEMFIESWTTNVSYEKFFEQCRPALCSYTLIDKYNLLFVITTIVGLYGGLSVFLKILVPIFVHRVYFFIERRRHRLVIPQVQRF